MMLWSNFIHALHASSDGLLKGVKVVIEKVCLKDLTLLFWLDVLKAENWSLVLR